VCRAIVERHVGAPAPDGWFNTSLTILAGEPPWRPRLVNCVDHLEGLTPDLAALGPA